MNSIRAESLKKTGTITTHRQSHEFSVLWEAMKSGEPIRILNCDWVDERTPYKITGVEYDILDGDDQSPLKFHLVEVTDE